MSWDIMARKSGETVAEMNGTHNVNPMIRAGGFEEWSMGGIMGMAAGEFADRMHAVFTAWGRDPERFRAMNPANGWGDFDSLREAMAPFLVVCRANPDAEMWASF